MSIFQFIKVAFKKVYSDYSNMQYVDIPGTFTTFSST